MTKTIVPGKAIRGIIGKHLKKEVQKVNQIKGKGQVNEIYVVTTESSKYVVRTDPNESTVSRFRKEAWCMGEAEKAGVLVPKALGIGMVEGHPYMLMSYVEGIPGDETDEKTQIRIWARLGEYAQKIHSIKTSGYSETMTSPGHFNGSWNEYLDDNLSSLKAEEVLLKSGCVSRSQSEMLKAIFKKMKAEKFRFGLIHNDLSLKNTVLSPKGEVHLLDWGSAEANVIPQMEMGEVLRSSVGENSIEFECFLKGYGMTRDRFVQIKFDIVSLRLLSSVDKVRWAIDKKPGLIENKTKELQLALRDIEDGVWS